MDIDQLRRDAEAPVVAGPGDIAAVAADLADAFRDDDMFDWFMRPDSRRDQAFARFFSFLVRMGARDGGLIERPAVGGAAAIWMPFEAVGPMSMMDEIRAAPTILFSAGLARVPRVLALQAAINKHHPTDRPHAYLWFLGVAPALQGHGLGSRLLAAANARLDAEGLPAYLETGTTRNVALYRRHGFEVISHGRPRPDAPPLWTMWRDPKADGAFAA